MSEEEKIAVAFIIERNILENRHCCTVLRRGDGMGICTACIIEDWCKRIDERIKNE